MAEHEIVCRDCGAPYTALRADAKTCGMCRQIRKLKFVGGIHVRPRTCAFCAKKYRATDQNDRKLCSECRTDRPTAEVDCVFHVREGRAWQTGRGPKVSRGVPYCLDCISDPEKYDHILKAMRNWQRDRKATYLEQR